MKKKRGYKTLDEVFYAADMEELKKALEAGNSRPLLKWLDKQISTWMWKKGRCPNCGED